MRKLGSILLVDDEETFRESTCRLLRCEGFDCHGANDADEGMKVLQESQFDLLIAETRMPANPDLRLVQAVRALDRFMPVILVTGSPSIETAIRSVELSVLAYLTKPVDSEELLTHVKPAVARSHKRRAVTAVRGRLESCLLDLENVQLAPIPRTSEGDEPVAIGTIRTLAACLSELLTLGAPSAIGGAARQLCVLLDCPQHPTCRQAIVDAIEVLRKTKETFKSKTLGELRAKLERVTSGLRPPATSSVPRPEDCPSGYTDPGSPSRTESSTSAAAFSTVIGGIASRSFSGGPGQSRSVGA